MGAERWAAIKGYEGLYEVSNTGKIRSLDRLVSRPQGNFVKKGRILKCNLNNKGYFRVQLIDSSGGKKQLFVHRLVADAFIPHDACDNVVNHLDFNPQNNNVENLEWTTSMGNSQYSAERGRMINKVRSAKVAEMQRKNGRPVIGKNIITGEEITFRWLNECSSQGFQPSCVSNCCQNKRTKHKGYIWRYASPDEIERIKQLWGT